jgi:hypothetical protein
MIFFVPANTRANHAAIFKPRLNFSLCPDARVSGGLAVIGLKGDAVSDPKIRKAAKVAWQQYGVAFLAAREPDPHGRVPWAVRKWGDPAKL